VAVTVPSFAKLNLDLRVLNKRPDGYHELRTIFQTVSLKDTLKLEFQKARRTVIDLESSLHIPDNLVVRAARLVLEYLKLTGRVSLQLHKRIPMGAGLGGGSSNAAAVLLALPALAKERIPLPDLLRLAEALGSDVAVFLHGGTVLGIGRGSELYPLPDQPARAVLILAGGIHVSTAEAYRNLNRSLTLEAHSPILGEFQSIVWDLDKLGLDRLPLTNDFEDAVFGHHPELARGLTRLRKAGAGLARMTGSGSALFGVFSTLAEAKSAVRKFEAGSAFVGTFVSRRRYMAAFRRALGPFAAADGLANK
jgi:4-diphosphocytidyl-2-C-methyl-D-erythritol kinase